MIYRYNPPRAITLLSASGRSAPNAATLRCSFVRIGDEVSRMCGLDEIRADLDAER